MSRNRSAYHYWLAYLIVIAGAGILVYWCRLARPLWVDEEMLALNARWRSFADLAGPLWLDQSVPLGWLVLERAALLTFGVSERAVRALPVVFGIGTLSVALWIGRRWMTPLGAAVLALLCAIGPWMVFFTLELKQYSSDTCWALLLPALAAWAVEGESRDRVIRRLAVWWVVAGVALWFSNGATFVAPACAAVLAGATWRQYGLRAAARAAAPGIIWLISFSAHYTLTLRHALGNEYLENYWRFAFLPVSDGVVETLKWGQRWVQSFPVKPVGTESWAMFWIAVIIGFAFAIARYGSFGVVFALVPVSALALGVLQIVPPFERLGLWCVPALYVGLAMCLDAALWLAFQRQGSDRLRMAAAVAAFSAAAFVSLDVVGKGKTELAAKRADDNYGLDDRRAVRHVQRLRQPGDPVLTTHFGLAGLWWYGGIDVSDARLAGTFEDSPVYEISYEARRKSCARHAEEMDALVQRTGRAVVYLGFRMNVEPEGFDKLVLDELGRRGASVDYRRYADLSHVVAFDFRQPPNGDSDRFFTHLRKPPSQPLPGCVAIRPARRW